MLKAFFFFFLRQQHFFFFFPLSEMTLRALKLHQFLAGGFEGKAVAEASSENRK